MAKRDRASIREVFFTSDRVPNVYFYTSNIEKFLQARAVFDKAGLILKHYKSSTDPYSEDYDLGKKGLLGRAIDEVSKTLGASSLFFVEDTSIRIDALSDDNGDFPSLAAKEWFANTSFSELDSELKSHGNNRTATVKSDIALYVPSLRRPVFFEGETAGRIADAPPSFDASSRHPWLTPYTFNGWIIPNGADIPLGQMSFEESWRYDFRVEALLKLLDRLEEYTAALNLSSQTYSRRTSKDPDQQLDLIPTDKRAFIIVGRTCAGKTTMGEHLAAHHDFRFIEASSVLRTLGHQDSERLSNPIEFAQSILEEHGADIVARKVLALLDDNIPDRLAITGFRTIEELECMLQAIPHAQVVFVEASERTRFERHIRRARADEKTSIDQFSRMDIEQWQFGLLRVAEGFADIKVTNEAEIKDYFTTIGALIAQHEPGKVRHVSVEVRPRHGVANNQLFRCLAFLQQAGRPLDCGELETISEEAGMRILHNNANKVLKRVPELARRFELKGSRVRYQITDAGRAYVRLMNKRSTALDQKDAQE